MTRRRETDGEKSAGGGTDGALPVVESGAIGSAATSSKASALSEDDFSASLSHTLSTVNSMLFLSAADRLEVLAAELADVLRAPLADPMAPEWIVVPSAGMERWLRIELARHLGASGPNAGDGVAANLDMVFPRRLASRVLTPIPDDEPDPWQLARLPTAVLEVLHANQADDRLGSLTGLPPGATWWGRARRLADLFDRYVQYRPEMIRRWAARDDVDGAGNALTNTMLWQPHLWRLVRDRVGEPSSAELRPDRLAAVRSGACPVEVPERVTLFGLSAIPGGAPFLELLDALATQRDVHLLLLQPSAGMAAGVRAAGAGQARQGVLRADDHTASDVVHPLLRSWARPAREAVVLLGDRAMARRDLGPGDAVGDVAAEPTSLLAKVQADLRAGTGPAGDFFPRPGDSSIRMHSCYGPTRQVEVLRDQILHLLADDATLNEDDILVLCPALNEFAPLVEAVFGPSASAGATRAPASYRADGPPALAYRIADRSQADTYPLLAALAALVELLPSRFSAAAVIDFISLAPVRLRFDFDDAAVTSISTWIETADTRWGLDGEHREAWGIPAAHEAGSWRAAINRLLMGVATSDDDLALGAGGVLPIGVEGTNTAVLGRVADLISRLEALVDGARRPRPTHEWSAFLAIACADLFAVDPAMAWQQSRLTNLLVGIADNATLHEVPCPVDLTLADIRRLLGDELRSTGGRPDFFRGGITVSSLTPLRGVPHRVVCLLGMDEGGFGAGGLDGDDLTALSPYVGDRDPRADTRQALLEAILAAGDHLVITRTGHSVVTNQPVPPAVPVAELRDVIAATFSVESRVKAMAGLDVLHPRQSFDHRNFRSAEIDGLVRVGLGSDGPWSFDPLARAGAQARGSAGREVTPFLADPLLADLPEVIDLADLRSFLEHPVKYFLSRVLQVRLPDPPSRTGGKLVRPATGGSGVPRAAEGRDLLLELDELEAWKLADRLLAHRRDGRDPSAFEVRELARGGLPPGRLAGAALLSANAKIEPLVTAVSTLNISSGPPGHQLVDVTLPNGLRVVGAVRDDHGNRPGPIVVHPSEAKPKQRISAWVDLMMLVAVEPDVDWWSVIVSTKKVKAGYFIDTLEVLDPDPEIRRLRALAALAVAVDCYRRGQSEPLALFPKLSPAVFAGKSLSEAWLPYRGKGDGHDHWIRLAFNTPRLADVLRLPVRPDDPDEPDDLDDGEGPDHGRVGRYARYLWGAVDRSLAPLPSGAPEAMTS